MVKFAVDSLAIESKPVFTQVLQAVKELSQNTRQFDGLQADQRVNSLRLKGSLFSLVVVSLDDMVKELPILTTMHCDPILTVRLGCQEYSNHDLGQLYGALWFVGLVYFGGELCTELS